MPHPYDASAKYLFDIRLAERLRRLTRRLLHVSTWEELLAGAD